MKRALFVLATLVLVVGVMNAQNKVEQLFRFPGSTYSAGSTWAASATHYSEKVGFVDEDSIHVTLIFTDTVDVDVYVINYGSGINETVGDTSAAVDSVAATKAAGYSKTLTLVGKLNMGAAAFQLKLAFVATGNDTQATEKYKMYIKRFRNNRPTVR